MHVSPLSYKIGACQIFVKNFSAKNKQIFEFGLVQPGPKNHKYMGKAYERESDNDTSK